MSQPLSSVPPPVKTLSPESLVSLLRASADRRKRPLPAQPAAAKPIISPAADAVSDSDSSVQALPSPTKRVRAPTHVIVIDSDDDDADEDLKFSVKFITGLIVHGHRKPRGSEPGMFRYTFSVRWMVDWGRPWEPTPEPYASFDDPALTSALETLFDRLKRAGLAHRRQSSSAPYSDLAKLYPPTDVKQEHWKITIPLSQSRLNTWGVKWQDLSALVNAELLPS